MNDNDSAPDPYLSDVLLEKIVPIMRINFLRDSYYADRIVSALGLSVPLSNEDMLRFFETQCRIKDAASVPEPATHFADGRVNPRVANAVVTTEVRSFIAMMSADNKTTREIVDAVAEQFGINLSRNYVAVIRKRLRAS